MKKRFKFIVEFTLIIILLIKIMVFGNLLIEYNNFNSQNYNREILGIYDHNSHQKMVVGHIFNITLSENLFVGQWNYTIPECLNLISDEFYQDTLPQSIPESGEGMRILSLQTKMLSDYNFTMTYYLYGENVTFDPFSINLHIELSIELRILIVVLLII